MCLGLLRWTGDPSTVLIFSEHQTRVASVLLCCNLGWKSFGVYVGVYVCVVAMNNVMSWRAFWWVGCAGHPERWINLGRQTRRRSWSCRTEVEKKQAAWREQSWVIRKRKNRSQSWEESVFEPSLHSLCVFQAKFVPRVLLHVRLDSSVFVCFPFLFLSNFPTGLCTV